MKDSDKINALAVDLNTVINRYRREYDMTLASVIGTIEVIKLELFTEEAKPK